MDGRKRKRGRGWIGAPAGGVLFHREKKTLQDLPKKEEVLSAKNSRNGRGEEKKGEKEEKREIQEPRRPDRGGGGFRREFNRIVRIWRGKKEPLSISSAAPIL